jgi:hypothetical protein
MRRGRDGCSARTAKAAAKGVTYHGCRDVCWREDKTRRREPNIVGAIALLRNALLALGVR